ncbi:hypothetical protein F511_22165 [Dorcoceras hygrometricum]|uniref:Uncharacterized protein n=1 Tax=Dorcoceras hygrometricum TaxID=472368 RepID=A0A2Z7CBF1_9LAMI|nr:hypothetical protein F511_22165 [Dorcoceras hygrometricum]
MEKRGDNISSGPLPRTPTRCVKALPQKAENVDRIMRETCARSHPRLDRTCQRDGSSAQPLYKYPQEYAHLLLSPTPDVPEVLDVVTVRRLNYLATSIGAVCGKRRRRYTMPPKRTITQSSGENSNTASTAQGSENPALTPAR